MRMLKNQVNIQEQNTQKATIGSESAKILSDMGENKIDNENLNENINETKKIEEYKPKSGLGLRRISEEEAIKIQGKAHFEKER